MGVLFSVTAIQSDNYNLHKHSHKKLKGLTKSTPKNAFMKGNAAV